MTQLTVAKIGNNPTVNYAVDELTRVLSAMDGSLFIDQRKYKAYTAEKPLLFVGVTDLVPHSDIDDEIFVDVKDGVGVITGANNRAVLIAVYRFLRELGCAWVRPGADGEVIPKRVLAIGDISVKVHEIPSYRHRGVCIEGSLGFPHIFNMIEWLPRVGMNIYFVQKFVPVGFFRRWYDHWHNPFVAPENLSLDDFARIWDRCEEEVLKRGLIYHAVGHGWTEVPFGIFDATKDPDDPMIKPEIKKYFALIDGKRELFHLGSGSTQLCYSNKTVRDIITDAIVAYCKDKPCVDVVHFWLADGFNNNCECDECQKHRPSDYYVVMLNELDKKLTAAGIDTKIVFLIYVDLLWSPKDFRVNNPDRFILMFAPISRTYTNALCDSERIDLSELMPYERNKLEMPKSVGQNVGHLTSWQEGFKGDGFIFDYHLMWDHFLDPGFTTCAKTLHRDMANLDKLGLNGSVSCQQQRCAFPTGLPLHAMAAALWNKDSKFEDVARDYYRSDFGEDGEAVSAYLARISELFDSQFMRNDKPEAHKTVLARMDEIDRLTRAFEESHINKKADSSASYGYLKLHAEYCRQYAELIRRYTFGDEAKIEEQTKNFSEFAFRLEPKLHTVFDTTYFDEVYQRWIKRVYSNKPTTEVDL